ncbi:MAG: periplasmic heavy metal sensor [Xanthobacteraceae bacterium]
MSISSAHQGGRLRYLLLGSLMLNLLFAGAAGAMAVQHSRAVALEPVAGIHHGIAIRIDRIAATLPARDGGILRGEFRAQAAKLAAAEIEVRLAQETVRQHLRAQPFDAAAVRTALAQTSRAREHFYHLVHEVVAGATAKMSPDGRKMLADWRIRLNRTVLTQ